MARPTSSLFPRLLNNSDDTSPFPALITPTDDCAQRHALHILAYMILLTSTADHDTIMLSRASLLQKVGLNTSRNLPSHPCQRCLPATGKHSGLPQTSSLLHTHCIVLNLNFDHWWNKHGTLGYCCFLVTHYTLFLVREMQSRSWECICARRSTVLECFCFLIFAFHITSEPRRKSYSSRMIPPLQIP